MKKEYFTPYLARLLTLSIVFMSMLVGGYVGVVLLTALVFGWLAYVMRNEFAATLKISKEVTYDRGNLIAWVIVLGTLFLVTCAYIVFTPVMGQLRTVANTTGVDVSAGSTGGNLFATWENWPLLVVGGIIIWAFVLSQKKEYGSNYM